MATFTYPTNMELRTIAQEKTPRLTRDRLIFDIMPLRDVNASRVRWEQQDNWTGLQQLRGINGEPSRVKRTGQKTFDMEPGVYGEFSLIDEKEMTERAQFGTWADTINVDDLTMTEQDRLLGRELDRIEYIGWKILQGTFSVALPYGAGVVHTDTYTPQTFVAGITWATAATAIPLANFRSVQLLSRGKGVNFGAQARAIMNRSTLNALLANTNANDLAGRRTAGLGSVLSLTDANAILAGEDLPQIVVYDEGYLDDAGAFQLYVPNNTVLVIGQRPAGQRIAEYQLTRNVNNPNGGPGSYSKIVAKNNQVPPEIQVHQGHNGGPAIFFPGSIVVMTV
jgi:hypothetical protein